MFQKFWISAWQFLIFRVASWIGNCDFIPSFGLVPVVLWWERAGQEGGWHAHCCSMGALAEKGVAGMHTAAQWGHRQREGWLACTLLLNGGTGRERGDWHAHCCSMGAQAERGVTGMHTAAQWGHWQREGDGWHVLGEGWWEWWLACTLLLNGCTGRERRVVGMDTAAQWGHRQREESGWRAHCCSMGAPAERGEWLACTLLLNGGTGRERGWLACTLVLNGGIGRERRVAGVHTAAQWGHWQREGWLACTLLLNGGTGRERGWLTCTLVLNGGTGRERGWLTCTLVLNGGTGRERQDNKHWTLPHDKRTNSLGKQLKLICLGDKCLTKFDGLVQDCGNFSVLAMELLQSCTNPVKYTWTPISLKPPS